ncbi:S8 family peptidase [Sodalis praecaptivus]|nr:S8 family serine peptidase [Sodalis praecaptivus]
MKQPSLYIYHSNIFDGNIYVKATGLGECESCMITLQKHGSDVATLKGPTCVFKNQGYGQYGAIATTNINHKLSVILRSNTIDVSPSIALQPNGSNSITTTSKLTKETYKRYDGIDKYYLQVKLEKESDLERLKAEMTKFTSVTLSLSNIVFSKLNFNHLLGDISPNVYKTAPYREYDTLVLIAQELELLDYVTYCSVVPDIQNITPINLAPTLVTLDEGGVNEKSETDYYKTPCFNHLQTYLDPTSANIKGMNVRTVWDEGENGQAATVRHLDFGVYANHENLKGNITVVHSRSETEDCNHGTASTGCIAAAKKEFGVTGIAYGSDYYFYDTGDLDLIVRDAIPGDIVSLDIQLQVGDKLVPVTDSRAWWDRINSLTHNGVVVILAAGNGGLDLSMALGNMNQYGDNGSTLIGASAHHDGSRCSFSNYNHSSSLINSWGDWSVVTTGYGSLQKLPGNDRNYSKDFSGTSSATPLSSGALALIQSYAIGHLGIYLSSQEIRQLIKDTGYAEGASYHIGHRPNVSAAIRYLKEKNPIIKAVIDGPTAAIENEKIVLSAAKSTSNVADITTYDWDIPECFEAETLNQSILHFSAPAVTQSQDFTMKLTVSDSLGNQASVTHNLLVTPDHSATYPIWDPKEIYVAHDKVSWKTKNWEAKWWNQGVEPVKTDIIYPGPWKEL